MDGGPKTASVGAVWAIHGCETLEVLLMEVSEIVEDKIPEALEAAVVRPLPLESKWRLVRHGEDVCVVCGV
jgi:hypothetical protein